MGRKEQRKAPRTSTNYNLPLCLMLHSIIRAPGERRGNESLQKAQRLFRELYTMSKETFDFKKKVARPAVRPAQGRGWSYWWACIIASEMNVAETCRRLNQRPLRPSMAFLADSIESNLT
jgi:hypothetical protein